MPGKHTVHCSICGEAVTGSNFFTRMAKLRRHRKEAHPGAHKKSVKKARKTRKTADPEILVVRKKLTDMPKVKAFKDFAAGGLIRVLDRKEGKFPEFALYARSRNVAKLSKSLRDAGLRQEEPHKWVLRTNKFSIFVYM